MKGGSSTKVKSVKTISTDLSKMSLDGSSAPPKKKSAPKVQAVVSSPPAGDSKGPPPGKKPWFKGGGGGMAKKELTVRVKGEGDPRRTATEGKGRAKMATKCIRGNLNFLFYMGYTQQFIFKKFRIS